MTGSEEVTFYHSVSTYNTSPHKYQLLDAV